MEHYLNIFCATVSMNTGKVEWIDLEIKKVQCMTHSVVSRIEEKFITGTSFFLNDPYQSCFGTLQSSLPDLE